MRARGRAASRIVETDLALALVRRGDRCRLLALRDGQVSDRTADVADAVVSLSGGTCVGIGVSLASLGAIDEWIDAQRAAEMVRWSIEASSVAHIGVLRALQDLVRGTGRAERSVVSEKVEQCRALVMSARGIGAELAFQQILREDFSLDALEQLLHARTTRRTGSEEEWCVAALLESDSATCDSWFIVNAATHSAERNLRPRPAPRGT